MMKALHHKLKECLGRSGSARDRYQNLPTGRCRNAPEAEKNIISETSTRVMSDQAVFTINGKVYTASSELPADTTLNTFIRDHAHLKGTKFMCLEGGCGACIVSAQHKHPSTGKLLTFAVNSCLVPVFACNGWAITTVEGIGNRAKGYHKLQKTLAQKGGSQCGFCSAGMVMNMYSLLEDNKNITMKEIENSFGGNICRCTGYRPILDSFKSFASDAAVDGCLDIEDLQMCPNGALCQDGCEKVCNIEDVFDKCKSVKVTCADGGTWYRPENKKEIFEILEMCPDSGYMLVGGNTAHGVYRIQEQPSVYIDISAVPELHTITQDSCSLILGANTSLTDAMNYFYELSKNDPGHFQYLKVLADHIDLIANVPVRNTGTLAGNLSIKHQHKEFPSDIFLMLETVAAQLVIEDVSGVQVTVPIMEYMEMDMNKKLLTQIILHPLDSSSYVCQTYKIMPRAQNAHAYVNAGFLCRVNKSDKFRVLERPTFVFGGIDSSFVHATNTESLLDGKQLMNDTTLKQALQSLSSELHPDHVLPDTSPQFRKGLAMSLFYKFILSLSPEHVSSRNKSGGSLLSRPLSKGIQDFDTDESKWPLTKPMPKIEAIYQCAGEAEYINDIPSLIGELHAALVLATKAVASSFVLDASEALRLPGVVAFFTAKDIPGENNFIPTIPGFTLEAEEIFANKTIKFAGQPLGVIVADSRANALYAASKVNVQYNGLQKPVTNVKEIIKTGDKTRLTEQAKKDPKEVKKDVKFEVSGKFELKPQYHFSMETQTCLCVPTEDGLDVYPAAQWIAIAHEAISKALKMPQNRINMKVRRLGGAYGAKITRPCHAATVCALVSYLLQKPVRIVLSFETSMAWQGKRFPCYTEYEVGVNNDGEVQYLTMDFYEDEGYSRNDPVVGSTMYFLTNIYDDSTWKVTGYGVTTDTHSNTWCRAPSSTEAIAMIENIMEHIANVVQKDPIEVRINNMSVGSDPVKGMINDLKMSSDYDKRAAAVETFNKENRWKKRGISLVTMNYPFSYWGKFHATVSIFSGDGTVAISHGGIECGQGINTKVSQVCAHILGIDVADVSVKPTTVFISPNNSPSGGSLSSEAVSYAVKICCEELLKRIDPIKKKMPDAKWKEIVLAADNENISLKYTYMFTVNDDVKPYPIFGVAAAEVEVDVLTGQHEIVRVDIIEDAGVSMSPEVDVGQVEGSYAMGIGYYLTEELVYNEENGELLTTRTWNYKPPGAKDIPAEWHVTLRKKAPNPLGVLRSKATGEPPLCLSVGLVFAIRNALESARKESGKTENWFDLDIPVTGEKIWLSAANNFDQFNL